MTLHRRRIRLEFFRLLWRGYFITAELWAFAQGGRGMMLVFFRRMPRIDYLRPQSLAEALAAIDPETPTKHQVYAGGTDLLLKLKSREVKAPPCLIDLKGIRDLDYVTWDPADGLRIGAVATIAAVGQSPIVREKFAALAQGVDVMASDQIQNRGTIVGNVC